MARADSPYTARTKACSICKKVIFKCVVSRKLVGCAAYPYASLAVVPGGGLQRDLNAWWGLVVVTVGCMRAVLSTGPLGAVL